MGKSHRYQFLQGQMAILIKRFRSSNRYERIVKNYKVLYKPAMVLMVVEIEFSMGNNFLKSSWCDVISFEMMVGRREWSEEAMLIRREGND